MKSSNSIRNFPAGLIMYWITTNLWTIGQQSIIKKRLGPDVLRDQLGRDTARDDTRRTPHRPG